MHSDAFILLSTHSSLSKWCSVWLRYEECPSSGRKSGATVMSKRILQQCVHVEWRLIFLHVFMCDHVGQTSLHWHKKFVLRDFSDIFPLFSDAVLMMAYTASFSCSLQTRVESGSPLLLQPFQFKVKWCVHSEMAFCTLLVYWDAIYLACWTSFATHSSGRWWHFWKQQEASSYHVPSIFVWFCCKLSSEQVKKKQCGIVFKGY